MELIDLFLETAIAIFSEKSMPMECAAAVLTAVCLWWVWRDFSKEGHRTLSQLGGPIRVGVIRRSVGHFCAEGCAHGCVISLASGAVIAVCAGLAIGNAATWFVCVILVLGFIEYAREPRDQVQLRERGMVLPLKGRVALVPYHLIEHCQWVKARRRLLVRLCSTREDCSVVVENVNVEAFTRQLAQYVEVCDADGNPLEVETERSPAEARDSDGPQDGELEGVVYPFRRYQFTLRTFLIAVVAVSAGASWVAVHRQHPLRQQRRALPRLERFAPTAFWDEFYVRGLDFSSSPVKPGNDDLAPLRQLPGLRRLNLRGAAVTDDGLRHLRGLGELEFLDLSGTRITDAGLVELHRLRSLKRLCLRDTLVTDRGVGGLRKSLPGVEVDR